MIGTRNSTVHALQRSRGAYALAALGKAERAYRAAREAGFPASSPAPMDRAARIRAYANQSGWTTDFTPAQRRRLEKKARRAQVGAAGGGR